MDDNFSEYTYQKPYFVCQVDRLVVATLLVEKPPISSRTYQFNTIFTCILYIMYIH